MHVATVTLLVRPQKRAEAVSAIDELMRRMRQWPGCLGCRLLADAETGLDLSLISEWEKRRDLDGFMTSRDFLILQGMQMLLREEPRAVLDDVMVRKCLTFRRPSAFPY